MLVLVWGYFHVQVEARFQGQHPLRVRRSRMAEASTVSDRIIKGDCSYLLVLCVYSLLMDARMMCCWTEKATRGGGVNRSTLTFST